MNPAQRIYELLNKARGIGIDNNQAAFDGWKEVFRASSEKDYYKTYIVVLDHIDELDAILANITNESTKNLFARSINPLKSIFGLPFSAILWGNVKTKITEELLYGLQFISLWLNERSYERNIEQSYIETWIKELEQIKSEVIKFESDLILKEILYNQISEIIYILERYSIYGNKGLNSEFMKSMGVIALGKRKRKNERFEDFKRVVTGIGMALSVASNVSQIGGINAQDIFKAIGSQQSTISQNVISSETSSSSSLMIEDRTKE